MYKAKSNPWSEYIACGLMKTIRVGDAFSFHLFSKNSINAVILLRPTSLHRSEWVFDSPRPFHRNVLNGKCEDSCKRFIRTVLCVGQIFVWWLLVADESQTKWCQLKNFGSFFSGRIGYFLLTLRAVLITVWTLVITSQGKVLLDTNIQTCTSILPRLTTTSRILSSHW